MSEQSNEPQITEDEKREILLKRQQTENLNNFMNEVGQLMDKYSIDLVIDQNSPIGRPSIIPVPRMAKQG